MVIDTAGAATTTAATEQTAMQEYECTHIDIQEAEAVGQAIVDTVQDLAVNVDIKKIQYNMGKMYEEARKLGFDGDELEQYGLCLKGTKGSC